MILDATHFADPTGGRVIQRIAQPDQAVLFELHSIKQIATKEVRNYPVTTVINITIYKNPLYIDVQNTNGKQLIHLMVSGYHSRLQYQKHCKLPLR